LGNNVLMTPLLTAIEQRFPQAQVDLVTAGHASAALFRAFPSVKAIHALPSHGARHGLETLKQVSRLMASRYDLAIDAIPRSRTARVLLGLTRARYRAGYLWGNRLKDGALTHGIPMEGRPQLMAAVPVHLLSAILSASPRQPVSNHEVPMMDLRLDNLERAAGHRLLERALGRPGLEVEPRIGLYALATGRKCYSTEWWQAVVVRLRELRPGLALLEFVPHDGRTRLAGSLPMLHSTRPRELGAALQATSLVVSADCGVMHLASAAGARTLGLFKVTKLAKYAPYGNGSGGMQASDDDPAAVANRIVEMLACWQPESGRQGFG
jgi:ADP-heptose:LPS heptosyltransferase